MKFYRQRFSSIRFTFGWVNRTDRRLLGNYYEFLSSFWRLATKMMLTLVCHLISECLIPSSVLIVSVYSTESKPNRAKPTKPDSNRNQTEPKKNRTDQKTELLKLCKIKVGLVLNKKFRFGSVLVGFSKPKSNWKFYLVLFSDDPTFRSILSEY